ncbi:DoxX family membrane protein [Streptomyces sp. MAR4 CNY-716]
MRIYLQLTRSLERLGALFGIAALRISIGIIYLWFGIPKFFPGVSPAEALASKTVERLTFGVIEGTAASVVTGTLETVLGLLLISGRLVSLTSIGLLAHMAGTFTPLFIFPKETWEGFCIGTLEGQYILKNLVIVAAAFVVIGYSKSHRRPGPAEVAEASGHPEPAGTAASAAVDPAASGPVTRHADV